MAGFSQVLEAEHAEQLDATARGQLRAVSDAAARAHALIADVLEYARLADESVHPEPTDLEAAVRAARAPLEGLLRGSGGGAHIAGPLPAVLGDPALLARIVGHLLENAVKFVGAGVAPAIRVWAERHDGGVRLWVEDNGIGIAPEHQARIFEPFERLRAADAYPGTGIGLAIVRRGVARMGGDCGVESTPGSGSRFWIELPAVGGAGARRAPRAGESGAPVGSGTAAE
jgi:signal transduction histidine kinase